MDIPALNLKNLVKDFGKRRAVDNISFKLNKGEILGLLGPNGAGKSTTIRMIMNIIAPDSGAIEIFGKQLSEEMKDIIGYLPEERGLYRKLTVSETVNFFGSLKSMKKSAIRKNGRHLLEKFDLYQHRQKKVEELSKGMAQKLQIITTLIHQPELLILDEPFSGLDPVNIEMVKDVILEMKKKGVTIIFSTHLMAYAEKIVDSVVMINKGETVLNGALHDVRKEHGTNNLHIAYRGDSSFVADLPYINRYKDYGQEMELELKDLSMKDDLLKALTQKLSLNSFRIEEPSLNNIFIHRATEMGGEEN